MELVGGNSNFLQMALRIPFLVSNTMLTISNLRENQIWAVSEQFWAILVIDDVIGGEKQNYRGKVTI